MAEAAEDRPTDAVPIMAVMRCGKGQTFSLGSTSRILSLASGEPSVEAVTRKRAAQIRCARHDLNLRHGQSGSQRFELILLVPGSLVHGVADFVPEPGCKGFHQMPADGYGGGRSG
jgi:hypothetical protein